MAMASLHLLPRNTSSNRKMHLSLSPSLPPALCNSFPLLAVRANPLRLQLQPQRSTGLVITKCSQGWIPPTPSQFEDPFSLDHKFPGRGTKRGHEDNQESHPDEPDRKRQRGPDGEFGEMENQLFDPLPSKRKRIDGETEASGDVSAVNVGIDFKITGDGEYVLKMKRTITQGSEGTNTTEVERTKQMAQDAAMLMLHGELLQDIGQKLLAQSRASLRSIYGIPPPPSDLEV